jgi:Fe-S cluster assembly protein SufD
MALPAPNTTLIAPYVAAFEPIANEPVWLARRRKAALDRFGQLGFPTPRMEAWRLTDLKPLTASPFTPSHGDAGDVASLVARHKIAGTTTLVFANGAFLSDASDKLPAGIELLSHDPGGAENFPADETALEALNEVFFSDGYVLRLVDGLTQMEPLHILHIGAANARHSFHTRNLIEMAPGTQARIVESFVGDAQSPYWTNSVTRADLAAEAALDYVKIVAEPVAAIHSASLSVTLAREARFTSAFLTTGALLSRQDVVIHIEGERAYCGIQAASLLRGRQEATLATLVRHDAPGGETAEVYKGMVEGQAHGVFQGKIRVDHEGQQTNANQLSQSLLLSNEARVDTKPELEIFADDVKCSHGATVGDLDADQLFYLEARGIPTDEARAMLIEGFVTGAFDTLADGPARDYLTSHIEGWLGRQGAPS